MFYTGLSDVGSIASCLLPDCKDLRYQSANRVAGVDLSRNAVKTYIGQ